MKKSLFGALVFFFILLLMLGSYIGVYFARVAASKKAFAAIPFSLGEPRAQLESRLPGWKAKEFDSSRRNGYVKVEYSKFPGLSFCINYLDGRVLCMDPIE